MPASLICNRNVTPKVDQIGIELAAKAGYDPRAAITLWQKMAEVGGKGPPEFLSTHPSPENREKELAALVPEMMPYCSLSKFNWEYIVLRFAAHQLRFLVLFPSPRTAEYHKYKMMEKRNLKSSADLIRYAVKHSLL